jgi:predicted extracellular nuclease
VIGTDAIRVGLIYKPAKVRPSGLQAPDVRRRPAFHRHEEPAGAGADVRGAGDRRALHGRRQPPEVEGIGVCRHRRPDIGDGQGNCNVTRTNAAKALVDWLATDPTGSGDPTS